MHQSHHPHDIADRPVPSIVHPTPPTGQRDGARARVALRALLGGPGLHGDRGRRRGLRLQPLRRPGTFECCCLCFGVCDPAHELLQSNPTPRLHAPHRASSASTPCGSARTTTSSARSTPSKARGWCVYVRRGRQSASLCLSQGLGRWSIGMIVRRAEGAWGTVLVFLINCI